MTKLSTKNDTKVFQFMNIQSKTWESRWDTRMSCIKNCILLDFTVDLRCLLLFLLCEWVVIWFTYSQHLWKKHQSDSNATFKEKINIMLSYFCECYKSFKFYIIELISYVNILIEVLSNTCSKNETQQKSIKINNVNCL